MYTPFLIKLNKGQFHLLKYAFLNRMPYSKNDPVGNFFAKRTGILIVY